MASYISSNANRFYTELESSYGQTPAITAQNRFPAVKLTAKNQLEKPTGGTRRAAGRSWEYRRGCGATPVST
jgi:hypothetical protein